MRIKYQCPLKSFPKNGLPAFPTSRGLTLLVSEAEQQLKGFQDFCIIDLDLDIRTAIDYFYSVRKLLSWQRNQGHRNITVFSIREYLKTYLDKSKYTRANQIKSFRRFFRDYLGMPELVSTFRLPRVRSGEAGRHRELSFTRTDLIGVYEVLGKTKNSTRNQALFLLYATSGLRRGELLEATLNHINPEMRSIILRINKGTKRTGITFYNQEAEDALSRYLRENPKAKDERLFNIGGKGLEWIFVRASKQCRVKPPITPQALRVWFSYEMGRLGVPDRYIDVFQGRSPRTILSQFYTPTGMAELKAIYDKAGLKVLS